METMRQIEIADYATRLLAAYGDAAEAEAARKARRFDDIRNHQEAETWRRIRAAIREMRRSPHRPKT